MKELESRPLSWNSRTTGLIDHLYRQSTFISSLRMMKFIIRWVRDEEIYEGH